MSVLGKVSLNLGELASNIKTQQTERKLPVTLRDGRLATEANLLVCIVLCAQFHTFCFLLKKISILFNLRPKFKKKKKSLFSIHSL